MNKLATVLLASVTAFMLVACGSASEPDSGGERDPSVVVAPSEGDLAPQATRCRTTTDSSDPYYICTTTTCPNDVTTVCVPKPKKAL